MDGATLLRAGKMLHCEAGLVSLMQQCRATSGRRADENHGGGTKEAGGEVAVYMHRLAELTARF